MADFCTEVVGTSQVTLVGNSIGCVACLSAAALLQDTKGLVLINAAGNLEIEEEVRVASVSELAWLACWGGPWVAVTVAVLTVAVLAALTTTQTAVSDV